MDVTLQQLEVFVRVVDEEGFVAAADVLGMSASTVSHSVASLEKRVGGAVLNRSPTTPTALGFALLPHARATLASARGFQAVAKASSQPVEVTVAAPPTALASLAPRLLELWKRHLPTVSIRLLEGDDVEVVEWVDTGAADSAIVVNLEPTDDRDIELAQDHLVLITRQDHPLAGSPAVRLADIEGEEILASTAGCEPLVAELFAQENLAYTPARKVRQLSTLFAMVDARLGITFAPTLAKPLLPPTLTTTPLARTITRHLAFRGPRGRADHPAISSMKTILKRYNDYRPAAAQGVRERGLLLQPDSCSDRALDEFRVQNR